jgi:GT2 family glycosyltransferase
MNTAVLILNWNAYSDTVDCLRSLLPNLKKEDYAFIIDNGSLDGSSEKIIEYFRLIGQDISYCLSEELNEIFNPPQKNYLVQNSFNLGFAAGINTVLKQLHELNSGFGLVWLLNNDTIVNSESLIQLKRSLLNDNCIAVVGSMILNLPDNGLIQCTGVKYFKFLGVSKLINKNKPLIQLDSSNRQKFDYLNGASMLIRLSALTQTGYFDERFFLYSEEHDLQLRLQNKGYKLSLDCNSIIYHKLAGGTRNKKHLFYFYYNTSAVLLSKKHFSKINTFCAIFGLTAITFIRTFPSVTNFSWGIKGIIAGLKK